VNPGVGLKNSQRAQRRKSNIGAEEQNLWWAAGYNIIAIPLAAGCFFLGRYRACGGGWCSVDVCQYVVVAINAQLLRRLDLSR